MRDTTSVQYLCSNCKLPTVVTFCFMSFIWVRCGIPCGSGCFNSLDTWRQLRTKRKRKKLALRIRCFEEVPSWLVLWRKRAEFITIGGLSSASNHKHVWHQRWRLDVQLNAELHSRRPCILVCVTLPSGKYTVAFWVENQFLKTSKYPANTTNCACEYGCSFKVKLSC